jgi:surface carbohydrate biosynthesis protein (TIGR04326 family)
VNQKKQTFLIWDSVETPESGYHKVVLWKSFSCKVYSDAISIPNVIEDNAVELKKQYLKFIYDIGEKKIEGQSVIDHMQIHQNFNYWWMTLIIEKCNYSKSTWINDAIRLLAFEKIIKKENIHKITLATSNDLLIKSFRLLCLKTQIEIELQHMPNVESSKSKFRRFYALLPLSLQAIASFSFNIVRRWPLKGVGLKEWKSTTGEITFISYFFNLVPESAEKGHYKSRYWAHLPDLLIQENISTNWLHKYVKDSVLPSAKKAAELIRKFNKSGECKQTHATLDSFLGWKVIWNTLLDWGRLFKVGRKIRGLYANKNDDFGYFRPYIMLDLNESLYGRTALGNLLNFNLFKEALRLLPQQKKGIYLQENQGWESSLIQVWEAAGHGNLIGVPHSTVRFWDLRYYFDSRSYYGKNSKQFPRPKKIAVNGQLMHNNYIDGGYNKSELVDVEALRYLYLNKDDNKNDNSHNNDSTMVLVLGDYLAENTHYQMRILETAYSSFSTNITLLVKPHPNCPIIPSKYPRLKMEVTMDFISSLLPKCNIAYTSNATSAAIDAYCANVPVISVLNPQTLNMSLLMGFEGVEFASNADELVNAINNISANKFSKIEPENIFWVDQKLSMWKRLLGIENINGGKNAY